MQSLTKVIVWLLCACLLSGQTPLNRTHSEIYLQTPHDWPFSPITSGGIPLSGLEFFITNGCDGGLNSGCIAWDRAENLLLWSQDLTGWTASGSPVVTATTVEDDDGGAYEIVYQTVSLPDSMTGTWSIWIAQDAIPPETRFPKFEVEVANRYSLHLNTVSGATVEVGSDLGGSHTVTAETIGGTDYWRLEITFTTDDAFGARLWVYPARGANADLTTASTAAVGEITIAKQQLTPGTSSGDYQVTTDWQRLWDWSGNNLHAVVGSAPSDTTNDPGHGIFDNSGLMIVAARGDFDGTDDFNTVTLALTGDWTFSLVLKADDNTSRGLFRNGATTPNISLDASGKVSYVGGGTVGATNAVAQDEWHMIAITKVGTTITHYLDGVANGSGTSGSGNAFANLRIGYDGSAYYDGMISSVAAHSRGLGPAENLSFYRTVKTWWNLDLRGRRNLTLAILQQQWETYLFARLLPVPRPPWADMPAYQIPATEGRPTTWVH